VQRVLVYVSETWATKVANMQRLERAERSMVRRICDVTLKDRKSNQELLDRLGVDDVQSVVRRSRLRWFGHVERKSQDDWVSSCREIVVAGKRGRGKKTWKECVDEDMKEMGINRIDAKDSSLWRMGIRGKCLTSASAETRT